MLFIALLITFIVCVIYLIYKVNGLKDNKSKKI